MEKIYKLILADSVFYDLESIPSRLITEILHKVYLLETFPELGFAVTDKEKWIGFRELIANEYKVLYTVDKQRKIVLVHFIKHGKMNFQ